MLLAEVRGENTPEKSSLNGVSNSKPPGHESDTLTTELPVWGLLQMEIFPCYTTKFNLEAETKLNAFCCCQLKCAKVGEKIMQKGDKTGP